MKQPSILIYGGLPLSKFQCFASIHRPSRARNAGTLENCLEVTPLKSKLWAKIGLLPIDAAKD